MKVKTIDILNIISEHQTPENKQILKSCLITVDNIKSELDEIEKAIEAAGAISKDYARYLGFVNSNMFEFEMLDFHYSKLLENNVVKETDDEKLARINEQGYGPEDLPF